MPQGMGQQFLSGAGTGAAVGSAIPGIGTAIGAGVGGLISLLGGLFSTGKSPQEAAYEEIFNMIKSGKLGQEAFSKGEIQAIVDDLQTMYRGAASLSATRVGQAIGESDVAGGQGYADYYMSNVAPILAQGEFGAAEAEKFGVQAYTDVKAQAGNEIAQALGLATQAAGGMSSMTTAQKGISGFLQTLNLLSTAGGNIGKLISSLNREYPQVNDAGQIYYP